jgi:tRNA G18 (ribose-2'-O)-methylase SpoU
MKESQSKFNLKKDFIRTEIEHISSNRLPLILIADQIRNIGNAGMIFRIADSLRLQKIIFFNNLKKFDEKILLKKSRSTSKYVEFEYVNNIEEVIKLKSEFQFVSIEKTNKSTDFKTFEYTKPICLIIGAERTGISDELMKITDISLHLPMNGINTSINVATAFSAVVYEIYNQISYKNGEF